MTSSLLDRIYILQARGPLANFGGSGTLTSSIAFIDRAVAEWHRPRFRTSCVDDGPNPFSTLADCDQLKVQVVSLALDPSLSVPTSHPGGTA